MARGEDFSLLEGEIFRFSSLSGDVSLFLSKVALCEALVEFVGSIPCHLGKRRVVYLGHEHSLAKLK